MDSVALPSWKTTVGVAMVIDSRPPWPVNETDPSKRRRVAPWSPSSCFPENGKKYLLSTSLAGETITTCPDTSWMYSRKLALNPQSKPVRRVTSVLAVRDDYGQPVEFGGHVELA